MHIEPTASQLAEIMARKGAPSFATLAEQIRGVERVEEGRISALSSGRLPQEVGPRPELELRAIWLKSMVIVGGLDHDQDAENPLDDDGAGKIYRSSVTWWDTARPRTKWSSSFLRWPRTSQSDSRRPGRCSGAFFLAGATALGRAPAALPIIPGAVPGH